MQISVETLTDKATELDVEGSGSIEAGKAKIQDMDISAVSCGAASPVSENVQETPTRSAKRIAAGEVDGASTVKKKRVLGAELFEPKDPCSYQALFAAENLPKHTRSGPQRLSRMWDELPPENKLLHCLRFSRLQCEYEAQLAVYETALPTPTRKAFQEQRNRDIVDRGAPPKPNNAYLLFFCEKRHEFGDVSKEIVAQKIGVMWRTLPENGKVPYQILAETMQACYEVQLKAYHTALGPAGRAALRKKEKEEKQKAKESAQKRKQAEKEQLIALQAIRQRVKRHRRRLAGL